MTRLRLVVGKDKAARRVRRIDWVIVLAWATLPLALIVGLVATYWSRR